MKTWLIKSGMLGVTMLVTTIVFAQTTQVVRGRIVDDVSNTPLIGVNVIIRSDSSSVIGGVTDQDGWYEIKNVPLGRQTLVVTYVGYQPRSIPNVIVTAGKEVLMNLTLTEEISQLAEITVTAANSDDKTATNNDLALVSARSFNVDDTKRYAGALGDPSRMAANFAGVIGGNDSRNDIVVRGNSPTGMLWQLEGLNIPNPNHFGSFNSTGGPVSMLNNNNLDKSDFLTSAFPAQYGNATAGVFDLRLRDGNNRSSEFLAQVGFNGFEVGAEGPFSKNSKASYIVNYRYSTLGIFQTLGINFGTGSNTPIYHDINFKVSLPSARGGKWSIFGLGGTSEIDLLGSEIEAEELNDENGDLYGEENSDLRPRYKTGILGVSYDKNVSEKTFIRLIGGYSITSEQFTSDSLVRDAQNGVIEKYKNGEGDLQSRKASLVFLTRTKFSARSSLTSGFYADLNSFDLYNRDIYANLGRDSVRVDISDNNQLLQAHTTWKNRIGKKVVLTTGLHAQYYSLSDQFVLEPRASILYQFTPAQSLSAGFGVHNQTQSVYTSYVQSKTEQGYELTNLDLGFSTSNQYVLTYDWYINDHLRLKAEAYYQSLENIPVERHPSSYAAINSGISFVPDDRANLVNEGTGTNQGLELTVEQFFHKGFYFLLTGSLFDSKYKGSDGIERNTAYNTQYAANALAGKEFRVGKKKNYLSLNLKATSIGGRYLTPIDVAASSAYNRTIYQESLAYSEKQDPYFRADFRISYRKEYTKSTLEFALDLQNVTNNQNIFSQSYNPRTNTVETQYQQGFFPVPYVRYTF